MAAKYKIGIAYRQNKRAQINIYKNEYNNKNNGKNYFTIRPKRF